MTNQPHHYASVTAIDPNEAGRIMSRLALLRHTVMMFLLQTIWLWCLLPSMYLIKDRYPFSMNLLGYIGIAAALSFLVAQIAAVMTYPEWPMNIRMCSRLRHAVQSRSDRSSQYNWSDDSLRVVELVLRERWNSMALDTATDLLLIHIGSQGVMMEGDCNRYWLPAESIVDVNVESIKPTGWYAQTHMVVIVARTNDGPIELPISYRDHGLGELRNSRRKLHAFELAQRINAIAKGIRLTGPTVPAPKFAKTRSSNPYAPPIGSDG